MHVRVVLHVELEGASAMLVNPTVYLRLTTKSREKAKRMEPIASVAWLRNSLHCRSKASLPVVFLGRR